MGIFSLGILYAVYIVSGTFRSLPFLIGIAAPFPLFYGPLWFLYARSLGYGHGRLRPVDLLHFIPALIGYSLLIPYLLLPSEWKISLMENFAERVPRPIAVGIVLMTVHGIIYYLLTVALLRQNVKRLLDFFSEIENISLRWLRNITLIIGGIWFVLALFQVLRLAGIPLIENLNPIVAAMASILVFTAGYLGLRQPEVFESAGLAAQTPGGQHALSGARLAQSGAPERYSKSGLSPERKEQLVKRLKDHLETEKAYLDSTLTLRNLAEALSVSEHNLSEAINTGLRQTFFELVNSYRVREVERRLKDPAHRQFTLTAIAFDCGFNSKSSFNSVFKKMTGQTPSTYKQRLETH